MPNSPPSHTLACPPPLIVFWDGKDYLVPLKTDAWRYLGFFLDPHLTFHYHVDFYATKTLSTVKSYPGLGNSSRGLTPIMKYRLYLSCVLPLMTYGYLLWFNPRRPQKGLISTLAKAQAAASRWILEAFRTSPRGGMEILAGLLPLRIHLQRLYRNSVIRFHSLPPTHVLKYTAIPHYHYDPSYTTAYHVRSLTKANSHLPLHSLLAASRILPSEHVFLTLPDLSPSQRLLDKYPYRITMNISHPPKNSDEFDNWLDLFHENLDTVVDSLSPYGFTDGSAHAGPKGYFAVAAYHAYRGRTHMHTHTFRASHAIAIDAELIALGTCIQHLIQGFTGHVHTYTDSQSAIQLIFDTSRHTSHSVSVITSRRVSDWLALDPSNHITLHWCPGHMGLQQNNAVDAEANAAVLSPPELFHPLHFLAWNKQTSAVTANRNWKTMAKAKLYRGHSLIIGNSLSVSSHKGGQFL